MPRNASQMNSGISRTFTRPLGSNASKSTPTFPIQEEWPPDQSEPCHAAGDEAGLVHQVAEYQSVPKGDDESGAKQKRPVLERRERDAEVGRVRRVLAHAHDPEHKDDPGRDEDRLDDSSSDVADG